MPLQANIQLPGMVRVNYPYQNQTITSHVKLAGVVAVPGPDKLPQGTQFIQQQIPPAQWPLVLNSHQLFGKRYFINRITYYLDGQAVREIDYSADEISSYQFTDDYLGVVYGDAITAGKHTFAVVASFYSPQNPGVTLFDVVEIPFVYDDTTTSILPYLESIAPQQFAGQLDHQIVMRMLDYALTQRTEGAVKNDIDFLDSLYDIDAIPQHLIPYLAKTVGYDYFAGLLGNDNTLREELRFLPDWQKSAGTKESILVLLRALNLQGKLTPLYLDMVNNVLITGVKRRYQGNTQIKVLSQTKRARFTFPLTHSTFIPQTVNFRIEDQAGTVLASFIWDINQNAAFWTVFSTSGWIVRQDGSPATFADLTQVYADQQRGGITIIFNQPVKTTQTLQVIADYQYEIESRPRANTRLSEFFDIAITSLSKPNEFPAKDVSHVVDIIKRSKPLRTKLREIELPVLSADAYHVNAMSLSSTGDLSKTDRLEQFNVSRTAVDLRNPVMEGVKFTQFNRMADGFLFSWEKDCNGFENRFGIFHSLAIEPSFWEDEDPFKKVLANDTLVQRGHAIIVNDDKTPVTATDRRRWLRQLGFRMDNYTDEPGCIIANNHLAHYHTIRWDSPQSPAVQTYRDMVIELDIVDQGSPAAPVQLNVDVMVDPTNRYGFSIHWDGGSTIDRWDLFLGSSVATESWDFDSPNDKSKTWVFATGTYTLQVVRFQNDAELEALYLARPNLRNYQFEVGGSPMPGKWYAIWDIEADFAGWPVHLSVFFPAVYAKNQGACCCTELGIMSTGGVIPVNPFMSYADFNEPEFNYLPFNGEEEQTLMFVGASVVFNQILGKVYQYEWTVDLEVYNVYTNEVAAIFRWNGGYWETITLSPGIAASLNPASNGLWTDTLTLSGTISYSGPAPTGVPYVWGVRTCAKKVGDTMRIDLSVSETDDFALSFTHRGTFGPGDDALFYYDSLHFQSLLNHIHDQGDQRMAAYDGAYFKDGNLFPGLRMTVDMGSVATMVFDSGDTWDSAVGFGEAQFVWDSGDQFDDPLKVWDTTTPIKPVLQIDHYPKRLVFRGLDTMPSLVSTPFEVGVP